MPKVTISFDATFYPYDEADNNMLRAIKSWINEAANVTNECTDYEGNILGEFTFPSESIQVKIED